MIFLEKGNLKLLSANNHQISTEANNNNNINIITLKKLNWNIQRHTTHKLFRWDPRMDPCLVVIINLIVTVIIIIIILLVLAIDWLDIVE